ncbi:MAG: hypothetical protein EF812_03225 [Methanosarcinales archaeon]|nr:MAG: hypothetical protein EF812_03225 [Methanosarcinales archaeon]
MTMVNKLKVISNEIRQVPGWGVIGIDFNFDSCKGIISVKVSFLAEIKHSTEHAQCGCLSGYFAGFFTEVLDQAIHVQEIKCKNAGAEDCKFTILPVAKKVWNFYGTNQRRHSGHRAVKGKL